MEPPESPGLGSARMPEDVVTQVYRYVTEHGPAGALHVMADDLVLPAADVRAAVDILIEDRLVREDNAAGVRLVAVDREIAAASLISPMEREIYVRREQIARIQARMDALRRDYARARPAASGLSLVEHVVGSAEVSGYLKVAADASREEIAVLRPGARDGVDLESFLQLGPVLAARGVTVRLICEHRSRADFATRTKIKRLIDSGAKVSTISHVPRAAVVFDRSLAVLLTAADAGPAASGVRSGHVVQFLTDMFGYLWDAATPVESFESGYSEVTDDLQLAIVNLMAKGFTDEVLARKLGMSVRTCRRHIGTVMRDLNAASRFQAGARAA